MGAFTQAIKPPFKLYDPEAPLGVTILSFTHPHIPPHNMVTNIPPPTLGQVNIDPALLSESYHRELIKEIHKLRIHMGLIRKAILDIDTLFTSISDANDLPPELQKDVSKYSWDWKVLQDKYVLGVQESKVCAESVQGHADKFSNAVINELLNDENSFEFKKQILLSVIKDAESDTESIKQTNQHFPDLRNGIQLFASQWKMVVERHQIGDPASGVDNTLTDLQQKMESFITIFTVLFQESSSVLEQFRLSEDSIAPSLYKRRLSKAANQYAILGGSMRLFQIAVTSTL